MTNMPTKGTQYLILLVKDKPKAQQNTILQSLR